ncbi:MAG: hypothetical protein IJ468_09845 [Lachnospiraceae bacterium]|nr:hypothetical protein [Lachnospiraceae bacterium]
MLIIDGNAVYEIDCDCAKQKGLFQEEMRIGEGANGMIRSQTGDVHVKKETYTGEGVTVAVLDSGIYPHPDFGNRIVGWYDAVAHKSRPEDLNGHGTQDGVTNRFCSTVFL